MPDYKVCNRCKQRKPATEFYTRTGGKGLLSECKECMKARVKQQHFERTKLTAVPSENVAIEYLERHRIIATSGKYIGRAWCDVVAFGAVEIEVKHSILGRYDKGYFKFVTTPKQRERGYLGELALFICEYPDGHKTYHIFPGDHAAFFHKDGRMKTGISFRPGQREQLKHHNDRVTLTQPIMDEHQDAVWMVFDRMYKHCQSLAEKHAS